MAVHSIDPDYSLLTPIDYGDSIVDSDYEMLGAYGLTGFTANYMNKAWNTVHSQWAFWITSSPDTTGTAYPGPGSFGECTNYRVETVVYQ